VQPHNRPLAPDNGDGCAICHGSLFVLRGGDGTRYPCVCSAERIRRHKFVADSLNAIPGAPDADGWLVPTVPPLDAMTPNMMQRRVYLTARRFVDDPTFSVLLLSDYGLGKTRLMHGMALALCAHPDVRIQPRYVKASALAEYIKAGIADGTATARALSFVAAPVLFVDDLGAHYDTAYVSQKMQDVLDARYERNAPTVISSNQSLTDMGGRLGDRFLDRAVYIIHALRGESVRESGIRGRLPSWRDRLPIEGGPETPLHKFRDRQAICNRCDTRPCQCEARS